MIETIDVEVNYGISLSDMIYAGKYDWVDENITEEHFAVHAIGHTIHQVAIVHYGQDLRSKDVSDHAIMQGFRPSNLKVLLAIGAQCPELQREFPIIGLGTVWAPYNQLGLVPFLIQHVTRRDVSLATYNFLWHKECRFALTKNLS
jgi:hypothetical protein